MKVEIIFSHGNGLIETVLGISQTKKKSKLDYLSSTLFSKGIKKEINNVRCSIFETIYLVFHSLSQGLYYKIGKAKSKMNRHVKIKV